MKKILIVTTILVAVVGFCTSATADTTTSEGANAGKSMDLTDGAATPASLTLNFSPSVAGQYITEGTTSNEQWYSIGTYHSGGSLVYATSSQQTSIWKASRETNEVFADTAIPATEADSNSESQWTGQGFEK